MWSLEHTDLSRATEEISEYWNSEGKVKWLWQHCVNGGNKGNQFLYPFSPKATDGMSAWVPFLWIDSNLGVFQHLNCSAFLMHFLKFVIVREQLREPPQGKLTPEVICCIHSIVEHRCLIKLVRIFVSKKERVAVQMLWSRQVQMDVNIPKSQGEMDIFYLQSGSVRNGSFLSNLII